MRFILLLLFFIPILASAQRDVPLAWDPVEDPRVVRYELNWGSLSGDYGYEVITAETTATATLTEPGVYFFAVRACGEHLCSEFSDEVTAFWPAAPVNFRFIP